MKNMEIKIIQGNPSHHSTVKDVMSKLADVLLKPLDSRTITVTSTVDLKKLSKSISKKYDCSIRDGVTGGCYGARDGSTFPGITIWMHAKEFTERYLDSKYGEQVNPWHLLNEHGKLLEIDGEAFIAMLDESDIEYKSDNTYNYQHSNSEDAGFIFDFQFDSFNIGNKHFLAVMFHCGGDARGNYTSKTIWQFDYEDDIYSVLFPSKGLSENEAV